MQYNGEVAVGGPWQTRQTSQLEISKLAVGPLDNNVYLLVDRQTGASLLIDAANEADRILRLADGKLDGVLTTHCHPDHFQALAEVISATGASTYASAEEAPLIPVPTEVLVADGDTITLGSVNLTAVALLGHRRLGSEHISNSLALIHRDADGSTHVFTGDAFFPGGVGNTCDDPAAYSQLLHDVSHKLFAKLPDECWVYPGHGYDTTLGVERPSLQEWALRTW